MKGPMRDLLASFRREHPFTYLHPEVLDLLEAAYEAGRNAEKIREWTGEEA